MAKVFTTATGTPITELLPAKGGRIASEEVAALRARGQEMRWRARCRTQPCWRWRRVRHRHQSGNTGYERPQLIAGRPTQGRRELGAPGRRPADSGTASTAGWAGANPPSRIHHAGRARVVLHECYELPSHEAAISMPTAAEAMGGRRRDRCDPAQITRLS
jgi:hypothetical protein